MNIYVCIKQVPDTETKIKLAADGNGIDTTGIKWIMSPYDEFAVEEALRLKEKNAGSTVTVLSAGPARVVETIRTALAMGADNGIHVEIPESADNNLAAKALAGALKKEAKITSGSKTPGKGAKAGSLTSEQVRKIAEAKMKDLNAADVEGAMRMIEGSARAMGLTVEG